VCFPIDLAFVFKEELLEDPLTNLDIANPKYDAHIFANRGIYIIKAGEWRDIGTMSWHHNENKWGHGLKENVKDLFGRRRATFNEVFPKVTRKKGERALSEGERIRAVLENPNLYSLDPVVRAKALQLWQDGIDYAALDAYDHIGVRLEYDKLLAGIEYYPGWTAKDQFYKCSVPFTKLLWKLERKGFQIDVGHFKTVMPAMAAHLRRIEREFTRVAGKEVNLASVHKVREFFYETLQKPVVHLTKGGESGIKQPSTDSDVLEGWAGEGDEMARLLIEYREIAQVYNLYGLGLVGGRKKGWQNEGLEDEEGSATGKVAPGRLGPDGRLHPTLKQHGTATGRLASADPNLQNIKKPDEDEYHIRRAFIPGEGKILVVMDYSALEMRILAHLSRDAKLIKTIKDGVDIHCFTLAQMSHGQVSYEEAAAAKKASKKGKDKLSARELDLVNQREKIKKTAYGIVYCIGAELLAHNLTMDAKGAYIVPKQEGQVLIDGWLNTFPGAADWIDRQKWLANNESIVRTVMGRPRNFHDLKRMSRGDRARGERQASNAPVQGSAADIVNTTMLRCDQDAELQRMEAEMLLQVHDEIIWEFPHDLALVEEAKSRIKEIAEHPFDQEFLVPMTIEIGHGMCWSDAKG
jgi:DNA polymerase-1